MVVDGKDRLELRDSLDMVKRHLAEYYKGNIDEEECYKVIKREVTR